jgi:hypothetical protein
VLVLVLALGGAAPAAAASAGTLSVHLEATVGEPRAQTEGVTSWSIAGRALYRGLVGDQTSSLTFYNQTSEPVATFSLVSTWPSKIEIGGLERDETFVCGIVSLELGGPCFSVGAVIAVGTARIVEHDLRPGGRLAWELVFPRAVCLRCP